MPTGFQYLHNAFYGLEDTIKKHIGVPSGEKFNACIAHAPWLNAYLWEWDIFYPLPAWLGASRFSAPLSLANTGKFYFPIGSYILYATPSLGAQELAAQKRRLGKTLMYFPVHSTHHLCTTNDRTTFEHVKSFARTHNFDSIMVCLYWKNVLEGNEQHYAGEGVELVSAGHMFDPMFLPRLRSVLSLCDAVYTDTAGTHVIYAYSLGKPVIIEHRNEWHTYKPESDFGRRSLDEADPAIDLSSEIMFRANFCAVTRNSAADRFRLVSTFGGITEYRTPAELRTIHEICNDTHAKGPAFFNASPALFIEQAIAYLREGNPAKASFLLREAVASGGELRAGVLGSPQLRAFAGDVVSIHVCAQRQALDGARQKGVDELLSLMRERHGRGNNAYIVREIATAGSLPANAHAALVVFVYADPNTLPLTDTPGLAERWCATAMEFLMAACSGVRVCFVAEESLCAAASTQRILSFCGWPTDDPELDGQDGEATEIVEPPLPQSCRDILAALRAFTRGDEQKYRMNNIHLIQQRIEGREGYYGL